MRLRWLAIGLALLAVSVHAGDGAWPRFQEGVKAFRRGELETAKQRFESALVADPGFCDAHFYLGQVCEKKKDVRGAVARYKKVEKDWPTFALAQERLGQIAIKLGDKKSAEHYFKTVVEVRPSLTARLQLAGVQLDLKKHKEAEVTLMAAEKSAPGDLNLLDLLGRLYVETDRFDKALAAYTRIADKMPRDAIARHMCGLCLKELGREVEAIETFEKVLKLDPFHKGTILRLLDSYKDDPAKEDRVEDLERRLEMIRKRPAPVRRVSGKSSKPKGG